MIKTSNYCRLCNYKKLSKKLILKPIPLSEKFNSKPFSEDIAIFDKATLNPPIPTLIADFINFF